MSLHFLKKYIHGLGRWITGKELAARKMAEFVPWGTQVWGEATPVSCPLNYTHVRIHNITFKNLKYICCSL